jgi:hypothetical protein
MTIIKCITITGEPENVRVILKGADDKPLPHMLRALPVTPENDIGDIT